MTNTTKPPSAYGFPDKKAKWPKVLAFDTSVPFVSIAWSFESYSDATRTDMARGQAEALMPMLEAQLQALGWQWSDVDALGVGVGPGNFTGIRISVAAARGLGLALGVPVFGIDAFRIAYGHHRPDSGTLIALPAPRDMAYVQGYGTGSAPQFGQGLLIDPAAPPVELQLSFGMQVFGHRAVEIGGHFDAQAGEGFDGAGVLNIAEMVEYLYLDANTVPPAPAPHYVKPPDAAPARDAPPRILP